MISKITGVIGRLLKRKNRPPTAWSIPIPTHLIQAIRAYQALMESGELIAVNEEDQEKFTYLKKYFPINYVVNDTQTKLARNVTMSHSEPFVQVGSTRRTLLFPHAITVKCRSFWKDKRDYKFLFIGLMTPTRKKVLASWQKRVLGEQSKKLSSMIIIKNSENGRVFPGKVWDEEYFKALADAHMVLCPNGDFVWTYRFFEAMLCGSIPIVEDNCEVYHGFTYYTMNDSLDKLVWTNEIAISNYKKALELLTIPTNILSSELRANN